MLLLEQMAARSTLEGQARFSFISLNHHALDSTIKPAMQIGERL